MIGKYIYTTLSEDTKVQERFNKKIYPIDPRKKAEELEYPLCTYAIIDCEPFYDKTISDHAIYDYVTVLFLIISDSYKAMEIDATSIRKSIEKIHINDEDYKINTLGLIPGTMHQDYETEDETREGYWITSMAFDLKVKPNK